ncbi:LacI family DNA-binding transcriptional regulator [Scopulibacillus cellulosilyticus]|uniref:LacI family DNA-binding transcriptional regulator n=1 Tax=Scopulibacillus cellulosilyticus TaxID=2665665 RepID=A0ABW2Q778_9BACL
MKPTIYDVAKEAGVSISTVSKVMNNTGNISAETRKRIQETMKRLNYQPFVASVKKRMRTIGLLIPNIADPFMAEMARSIEDQGRKLGLSLMVCSTDNDLEKEVEYISMLQQKYIDGIIVATGLKRNKAIKALIDTEIPVVLLSRDVPSLAIDTVIVDDFFGAFEATSYLIKLGHKRIAMITEDIEFPSIECRFQGYKKALENAGLMYDEGLVSFNNISFDGGKKSALALLQSNKMPTAIFASTESLAIGTIQSAHELNVKIPEDLSVIGFDNTILATMCVPQLTTIAQPIEEMAQKAIELLIEEINTPKKVRQRVVLSPELIVRDSTGKAKQ